jgi:hypothetical protein
MLLGDAFVTGYGKKTLVWISLLYGDKANSGDERLTSLSPWQL